MNELHDVLFILLASGIKTVSKMLLHIGNNFALKWRTYCFQNISNQVRASVALSVAFVCPILLEYLFSHSLLSFPCPFCSTAVFVHLTRSSLHVVNSRHDGLLVSLGLLYSNRRHNLLSIQVICYLIKPFTHLRTFNFLESVNGITYFSLVTYAFNWFSALPCYSISSFFHVFSV